jgi:hypothetical protein
MITKSKFFVGAVIILTAGSAALAKGGGLPKLDIERACHASEQAVAAVITVTSDMFSACVSDEKEAQDQLDKNWATYPAVDKTRCIQPKEYMPGYVEWLTCLEMDRDVKVMRKEQPGPASSSTDKCPVVRYLQDGTIVSVKAC